MGGNERECRQGLWQEVREGKGIRGAHQRHQVNTLSRSSQERKTNPNWSRERERELYERERERYTISAHIFCTFYKATAAHAQLPSTLPFALRTMIKHIVQVRRLIQYYERGNIS